VSHPVIVGADDAASTGAAVDWAADEADLRGARLHLVHAWQGEPEGPGSEDADQARQSGAQMLDALVRRAADRHPELRITSGAVEVPPREALTALSAEAQLLVLGSRGRGGFPALLIGSTSLHLAAHAACPVVVVPGNAPEPGAGVAVGLDGRQADDEVLAFAFETAQRRQLPLTAVHAWSYPLIRLSGHPAPPVYELGHVEAEEARLVAELLAGWREKYPGVPVAEDIVRSGPAKRLVALSGSRQLLVVGRRGTPDGPVGRLGSVSQAVVQHARCPVAVVPVG